MGTKPIWERKRPARKKTTHLNAAQKRAAKKAAKKAGRRYPNLVDNARVARKAKAAKKSATNTAKRGKSAPQRSRAAKSRSRKDG